MLGAKRMVGDGLAAGKGKDFCPAAREFDIDGPGRGVEFFLGEPGGRIPGLPSPRQRDRRGLGQIGQDFQTIAEGRPKLVERINAGALG